MSKQKLGRGLGAILDDVEEAYRQDMEGNHVSVKEIPLDKITPNVYQPRKHFNQEALQSLSDSIVKHGLLQPIVVVKKDDGYMIIAGERRFRASGLAGLETIEAIVADFESKNLRELALIENIQREDLTPIELASSYKELISEYMITQEELSDIVCKSRSHIANTMRLLTLSDYTKELLNLGKITQGHAKVLVGLDVQSEKLIVDTIVGQKLSVRECEDLIKRVKTQNTNLDAKSNLEKSETLYKKVDEVVLKVKKCGFNIKRSGDKVVINFKDDSNIEEFLRFFK
ncbi:MAG TPA: ParB/RepB/Spo0J family partition protein [Campylobacterales bacterium]|nr:ParB/RepB/Spo0J family partition protein [Campylobacterales bacterium]